MVGFDYFLKLAHFVGGNRRPDCYNDVDGWVLEAPGTSAGSRKGPPQGETLPAAGPFSLGEVSVRQRRRRKGPVFPSPGVYAREDFPSPRHECLG